jgi:hypothetical protein
LFGRTDKCYEELGTLISVVESEIDDTILFNLTKDKVNHPNLINSISTNLDEIVGQIKKIGQELSIESYMHFYITGLQRLNTVLKSAGMLWLISTLHIEKRFINNNIKCL